MFLLFVLYEDNKLCWPTDYKVYKNIFYISQFNIKVLCCCITGSGVTLQLYKPLVHKQDNNQLILGSLYSKDFTHKTNSKQTDLKGYSWRIQVGNTLFGFLSESRICLAKEPNSDLLVKKSELLMVPLL